MLSVIDTADRKHYDVLNARRDLALASTARQSREIQVRQAVEEVTLATLQRDRSQDQVDRYDQLIRAGLTGWETASLAAQWATFGFKQSAVISTVVRYSASAEGWGSDVLTSGADAAIASADVSADAATALAQAAGTQAQFERRQQDWMFHAQDAAWDRDIANQQIRINQVRLQGAEVDREVAELQVRYGTDALSFLTDQSFANEALYEWMASVVEGIYRFFLQQATQIARLAELQLAFERQEAPKGLVKSDYSSRPTAVDTPT